jgi:DNA (cytosine-5)-methyltransferase 1
VALPAFDVLSVCSGGGGLDLGLRLAEPGARVVGYVEREAFAAAVLVARMEDAALCEAPVWDDVATFDGRPWRGVVDCVVAGFPCQPWSIAGRRGGTGDARWLWPEIARLVREVAPRLVFLENVPGLRLGGGLGHVLGDLAQLGFHAEWDVLGADEVGATHRRRRLFVLAYTDTFGRWARAGRGGAQGDDGAGDQGPRGPAVGGGVLAARLGDAAARAGMADPVRDGRRTHGDESAAALPARDVVPGGPEEDRWRPRDLFPPGPSELERWRAVLASRPELTPATQPGVHGVADGLADRLVESIRPARLQLLGNGVVPLQAARAWTVLMARALGEVTA